MENAKNNSIIMAGILLVAIAVILVLVSRPQREPIESIEEMVCTQEAKLCPDGSYVGRVPPLCEFAPCGTTGIPDK